MIAPLNDVRVYLVLGNTDLRKSIDGLSALVAGQLGLDPFCGHLFAFANRSRTAVKILIWDRNGFWVFHKRLEKQRFRWPKSEVDVQDVTARELRWLLDRIDPSKMDGHKRIDYSHIV